MQTSEASKYVGQNVSIEYIASNGMPFFHEGRVRLVKMYLHLETPSRRIYKIRVNKIKAIKRTN